MTIHLLEHPVEHSLHTLGCWKRHAPLPFPWRLCYAVTGFCFVYQFQCHFTDLGISRLKQWVLLIYQLLATAIVFWNIFSMFGTHHANVRAMLILLPMVYSVISIGKDSLRSDSFSQKVDPSFHSTTRIHPAVVFRWCGLPLPTRNLSFLAAVFSSDAGFMLALSNRCRFHSPRTGHKIPHLVLIYWNCDKEKTKMTVHSCNITLAFAQILVVCISCRIE